jgi:hypothetical protein
MKTRFDIAAIVVLGLAGSAAFAGCGAGDIADTSLPRPTAPSGPATTPTPETPVPTDPPLPPSAHVLRLTHPQWENSVRDLLRLDVAPGLSTGFLDDPSPAAAEFGLDSSTLAVDPVLWVEYRDAAEAAAVRAVDDPVAFDRLLPDAAKVGDTDARVRAFVTEFLPRAYRRPVTPAEIDAAIAQGEKAVFSDITSDPVILRIRWIIAAALQSPYFLYRLGGGEGAVRPDGRYRLGPYELATKLSYALWGTMPDGGLTANAAAGHLSTSDGLAAVVTEMMKDPRTDAQLLDFHDQLFLVGRYASVSRQPATYPAFYPEFGRDAQEDTRATVRELVIKNPGKVTDLYTSTAFFMNARLAPIYGVDPSTVPALVTDPGVFVKVPVSPQRVGLLTHAGWLAFEGHAKDPSTIQRGAYMARRVLCIPLGAPPAAAKGKDPATNGAATNRLRVEATTACGTGCHNGPGGVINPLGFGFEEFDSLGQQRTHDGTLPIDSSGTTDETGAFTDSASLMSKVAASTRLHACYAAHWSAYLNGQSKVDIRPKWLSPIVTKSLAGASVREIVAALVQTDAFLTVSRE